MAKAKARNNEEPSPYREGFDAARNGSPKQCPDHYISAQRDDWNAGWDKGRQLYDAVMGEKQA